MNFSPEYLIKILERNGFFYKRSRGSHKLFYNPLTNKTVIVPYHNNKDLKKGTFFSILRQAGLHRTDLDQ